MTIIIIYRWTTKFFCITVVTYSSILCTVMQCIAWEKALLWEKNGQNWSYKAQKSASEVSWVADWQGKRAAPPFPLPRLQLGSPQSPIFFFILFPKCGAWFWAIVCFAE